MIAVPYVYVDYQGKTLFSKGDDVPSWVLRFNPDTMKSMKFGVDAEVEIVAGVVQVYPQKELAKGEATIQCITKENWKEAKMKWPTEKHHPVNLYGRPKALITAALEENRYRDCIQCQTTFKKPDELEFRCPLCRKVEDDRQSYKAAGERLQEANNRLS
jgi:hypothetical protein